MIYEDNWNNEIKLMNVFITSDTYFCGKNMFNVLSNFEIIIHYLLHSYKHVMYVKGRRHNRPKLTLYPFTILSPFRSTPGLSNHHSVVFFKSDYSRFHMYI